MPGVLVCPAEGLFAYLATSSECLSDHLLQGLVILPKPDVCIEYGACGQSLYMDEYMDMIRTRTARASVVHTIYLSVAAGVGLQGTDTVHHVMAAQRRNTTSPTTAL